MWIMLIKKLPVVVSPPALSLFWASEWPYPMGKNFERDEFEKERLQNALSIFYKGEKIRVFPEEYSKVTDERMAIYCDETQGSHVLVEGNQGLQEDESVTVSWKDKEERLIYDSALTEGCTPAQAMRLIAGLDVEISSYPPIGYYRVRPEYGEMFFAAKDL